MSINELQHAFVSASKSYLSAWRAIRCLEGWSPGLARSDLHHEFHAPFSAMGAQMLPTVGRALFWM